jgi:hypothetical protein
MMPGDFNDIFRPPTDEDPFYIDHHYPGFSALLLRWAERAGCFAHSTADQDDRSNRDGHWYDAGFNGAGFGYALDYTDCRAGHGYAFVDAVADLYTIQDLDRYANRHSDKDADNYQYAVTAYDYEYASAADSYPCTALGNGCCTDPQ